MFIIPQSVIRQSIIHQSIIHQSIIHQSVIHQSIIRQSIIHQSIIHQSVIHQSIIDDTNPIFKQSLTGLNSEFSFSLTSCFTKAEEPSLPYYLPIAGGRIIGFIPFPRLLVLYEMHSVSSRIWTHVTVSVSYDDNITPQAAFKSHLEWRKAQRVSISISTN